MPSEYLPELLTVMSVNLVALISPGPDFVIVSRNALTRGRRSGIYTAIGGSVGILLHLTYSLVGIGLLIANSVWLFSIIKFAGAGYLIYIGAKSLFSKNKNQIQSPTPEPEASVEQSRQDRKNEAWKAFRAGFLTNILNPKVTLFFLALFTQIISPATPINVRAAYAAEILVLNIAWFSLVATMLSQKIIKARFLNLQKYIERGFGALLIAFGFKVILD